MIQSCATWLAHENLVELDHYANPVWNISPLDQYANLGQIRKFRQLSIFSRVFCELFIAFLRSVSPKLYLLF